MWPPREPTDEQRRALDRLRSARRPLLVGHERPDADVLGSQAALARGLAVLGARPTVLNPDAAGRAFGWIEPPCGFDFHRGRRLPEHDLVVLLDLCELERTGSLAELLRASAAPRLVIDHHRRTSPGEAERGAAAELHWFHDDSAAATGVLVARALVALGIAFDAAIAQALLVAIVSDTGSFRYDTTNAEVLALGAACVAAGASTEAVQRRFAQDRDPCFPQALGALLARVRYLDGGRVALVDEPAALGLGGIENLSDAVLDVLRSVGPVEVALHLRELADGNCRVSLRAKPPAQVHALAVRLGGGGHARAAAATLPGPFAHALARLEEELAPAPAAAPPLRSRSTAR
jgi:phosphoesterase RecJ-like protein